MQLLVMLIAHVFLLGFSCAAFGGALENSENGAVNNQHQVNGPVIQRARFHYIRAATVADWYHELAGWDARRREMRSHFNNEERNNSDLAQ